MDRRTSLKTLVSAGLAASLHPLFALGSSVPEKKLGIALVGLGGYATRQLAPALQSTQHCYLAGIVSGTPEKRKNWKQQYQIPEQNIYTYETFDQIADNDEIDIVYIVLPNFMHAEYTIRALQAGKHVICEKPMGMNAEECRQMLAARDKSGKKLQIGYRLYYEQNHTKVHRIGQSQEWGKVLMVESGLGFRMAVPGSWRMDPAKGGGGAIMDLGVYCIQAARNVIGVLPESVTAQGYVIHPELFQGIFETVTFQLQFPGGAISNSTTSFNAYVDRFHTTCENGWVSLNPAFNAGRKVVATTNTSTLFPENPAPYQQIAQMDAFAQNILQDTPVLASGEEGCYDMVIIDAMKRAIETGQQERISY